MVPQRRLPMQSRTLFSIALWIWTLQLLKARKPRCAMIEQVTGWHFKPNKGGPSCMEMFIRAVRTEMPGYGVEVVELDQKPWLEGARPRHLHKFIM